MTEKGKEITQQLRHLMIDIPTANIEKLKDIFSQIDRLKVKVSGLQYKYTDMTVFKELESEALDLILDRQNELSC